MPATTTDAESPPSARQVASPAALPVLRETAAARSTRLSHAALLAATVEEVVAEWLQRIGAAAGSVSASAAGARRESLVALGAAEEEPGRRRLRGGGIRVGSGKMRGRESRPSSRVRAPGRGGLVPGASCTSPPARRRSPPPPPPHPPLPAPPRPSPSAAHPPPWPSRRRRGRPDTLVALGGGEARAAGHCLRRSRRRQRPRQRRRPPQPRAANRYHRCRRLCAEDGARTPSHTLQEGAARRRQPRRVTGCPHGFVTARGGAWSPRLRAEGSRTRFAGSAADAPAAKRRRAVGGVEARQCRYRPDAVG